MIYERIEAIQKENAKEGAYLCLTKSDAAFLLDLVSKLVDALQFYASTSTWEYGHDVYGNECHPPAQEDMGAMARTVLEKL